MREQWDALKEAVIELRDNKGTLTQQEVCQYLANLMNVLEAQIEPEMSDDLISRQDAINLLKKMSDGYSYIEVETESAIKQFQHLPSAQKWIPVTERLPEENKPVLVTHHGKLQAFVSVDWIDPYTHDWNRTCNVTAWQPLPKPWKGADDAET